MPQSEPLQVEVYLQPPPAAALRGAAALVLDIFRATTVHAALFAGGARAVYPVPDFAAGAALRDQLRRQMRPMRPVRDAGGDLQTGCALIGEVGALPPPEADYGNSPTEFASLDVSGWTVVHVTSNGTRALVGAAQAALALSACLRNMQASLACILADDVLAGGAGRVAIVCSGDHGGAAPSVEDAFAAGAFVDRLKRLQPQVELRGGARLALRLYHAYGRSPARAFADSPHGDRLRRLGFDADFAYAAAVDVDASVIRLRTDAAGRPVLRLVV